MANENNLRPMQTSTPLLYYTPGTCALAGIVTLCWINKPFQLCHVSREQRLGPVYKTINPHGKVPALQVDDRIITEVSAILLHLTQHNPDAGLSPAPGTPAHDDLQQWYSYLGSGFHAAFYPYFKPHNYVDDEALYPRIRDAAKDQIRQALAFVDAHLHQQRFLLGEQKSSLDGYLFAMARWSETLFDYSEQFPNLRRMMDELLQDDGLRLAMALEQGEVVEARGPFIGHLPLQARD